MRSKLEVIWSIESTKASDQILQYLHDEWTEREINNFLEALHAFEDMVSVFPQIYPESPIKKGYRKAVIVKQVSAIYSIENDHILVHTLFDNRQDPEKLINPY